MDRKQTSKKGDKKLGTLENEKVRILFEKVPVKVNPRKFILDFGNAIMKNESDAFTLI